MFTLASIGQDVSICLRCQYRIAIHRRPKPGRQNRLPSNTPTRHMALDHRLLQNESQSRAFEQTWEEFPPLAQESNDVELRPKVWKHGKNEDTYSTADLEMDALGEPAKIIILPKVQRPYFFQPENAENTLENQNTSISPTEMLENIQEERALVDFGEASFQIEKLRNSQLSQSQSGYSTLPKDRYLQLLDSLQDGFTRAQLGSYYNAEVAKLQESAFELAHPYSATLCARSSWVPECSPFLGKAAEQLTYLKNRRLGKTNDVDEQEIIPKVVAKSKPALLTKPRVAKRIIQVLWNVQVPEELGQLDMWIKPLHLGVLLSDRKSMFNRITETYGAKVDVSQSRRLIRITSYKNICSDIFQSILQALENIKAVNFCLPCVPSKKSLPSGAPTGLEDSLIKKIALDTGTTIERVPNSTLKRKGFVRQYRISYLGPDQDGLVSAKEELIEASRFRTSHLPSVVWDQEECSQGRPRLVEGISAMPIVARETKWSRWASPIKRNPDEALESKSPETSQVGSKVLLPSIFNILILPPSSLILPESYQSLSWNASLKHKIFATFGQVLYPREHLEALSHTLESENASLRSKTLRHSLFSRRQLFGSFPGLRFMLQSANSGTQVGEDLRVMLRPSPEFLMEEGDKRIFPDVELRIKCDSASKTCEFSNAKLILDRQEMDLLLPTEMVDIRFASTSHILSGTKTDSELLSFLSSSNIDGVFAQETLTFPDTVNLSIPAHLVRKSLSQVALPKKAAREVENTQDPFVEGTPDIDVKYTLSHYENWSYMSGNIMGLDFQYSVVTSSGKMRKREEIRMTLHGGEKEGEEGLAPTLPTFEAHYDVLSAMIARLKDVNRPRGSEGNIAASLVPNM